MATETRRIVEATPQHAPFLAWVTLTAFRSQLERGFWDFMLGGDEAYKLRYLEALTTTEQRHWVHYSTFIVAEVGGRPASAQCGYRRRRAAAPGYPPRRSSAPRWAAGRPRRCAATLARSSAARRCGRRDSRRTG